MISRVFRYGLVASLIIFLRKVTETTLNKSFQRRFNNNTIHIGSDSHISDSPNIFFGKSFYAGKDLWLESVGLTGKVTFGDDVRLSNNVHIASMTKITIGNNVLIGSNVLISDHSHGSFSRKELDIPPYQRSLVTKGGICIESNVWICDGVVILSGVTIGTGSVIAANSVVIEDVPAYSLVAGIPAQVKRCFQQK